MRERIVWVDWMKAILILLVVLGHSGSLFAPMLYLFHIPAFFFISGYLCNYDKKDQGTLYSSRYLIYSILLYNVIFIVINALHAFITGKGIMHAEAGISIYELLIRPILGITWCYYKDNPLTNPICAQFWFVWVLIILRWFGRFICNRPIKDIFIIIALCVLYMSVINYWDLKTFFYMDRTIAALPFYVIGNWVRKRGLLDKMNIVSLRWLRGGEDKIYIPFISYHFYDNDSLVFTLQK